MNLQPFDAGGSGWRTLFLRNRYLLVLSIVVALAAGMFAFQQLRRTEDPRITNLYPIIITPFPGASRPFHRHNLCAQTFFH